MANVTLRFSKMRVLMEFQKALYLKKITNKNLTNRYYTIRRALFYVPGSDEKKLAKALTLKVDCLVMDCEDGVAINQKENARKKIKNLLDQGPVTKSSPEWSVRINPVIEPQLCEADLNVLLSAKSLPGSICLPKVNHPDHLHWVKSAAAVANLLEICRKAQDLSSLAPVEPVALVFGSDDLRASLGAIRTSNGMEIFYARQKIVLFAKAFGLQAIDMVHTNFTNLKELQNECEDGLKMGYTGKQVIHPNQITVTQDAFVPSVFQINWAKKVMKAFIENQEKGRGAFSLENSMVDMPTVRQARNILETAKIVGKLPSEAEHLLTSI